MSDVPLRGSSDPVNSVGIPYAPADRPTSTTDTGTRIFHFAVWMLMFVVGLVYVGRYSWTNPYVDEWDFVPVLFGEQPAGPWLWELHNEHRFPLPRLLYLGLFRLTGDLRAGCLVSFIGMSLLAAGLVALARRLRGRAAFVDAIFPLTLMHTGQGENLYMGYQMCFMLVAVFAGALLAVIVLTGEGNRFRRGLQAIVLGWLLLTCGAAGLAYGVAAAAWAVFLASGGRMPVGQRVALWLLAAVTPVYIWIYFQGYARPVHHPESAGVWESARVGLEAQSMAFGPAATGLGPIVGVPVLVVAVVVLMLLIGALWRHRNDRPRPVGLLLYLGAAAAVAFGIGWGRSGFLSDMGFAWRYGWIVAPGLWAGYFTCVLTGGRVAAYCPLALFLVALAVTPVNSISGFLDAERKVKRFDDGWEADVRAGLPADEVVRKHYPEYSPEVRARMAKSMQLMRDRGYTYYGSLGVEDH
jgi:hypothetical protein